MTATTHIAHPPVARARAWWTELTLRHSRRVQRVFFQRLHDSLPLTDPDRHALEAPALEDAFAHLAIDHPDTVTPADGGQLARAADREQQLLAACDAWFRDVHGPEYTWPPRTIAAYNRLIDGVHKLFTDTHGGAA
ncbi:hypothetical protein ACIOWI_29515 [Streptomyces sp. NPDC087659]|uniref:hypothetical protein n=1 Tax=Streptomyces sp. NPDC087659 TaxID=3365801 RepID=UPI003813C804